jgi:translocator assembly and maintenance protein 41
MVFLMSQTIKYGVTSLACLERDLLNWEALYLAGRLHKPVEVLASHPVIEKAQETNLQSALRTALLLLPRRFTMQRLLRTICDLSYVGDIRMGLAEDERKVDRIIQGSYKELVAMYEPPLRLAESEWGAVLQRGDWVEQSMAGDVRAGLIASLPAMALSKLATAMGRPIPKAAFQSDPAMRATLAMQVASFSQSSEMLQRSLASIVRASSRRQTVMGLFSAGILKSALYAWKKVNKRYRFGTR